MAINSNRPIKYPGNIFLSVGATLVVAQNKTDVQDKTVVQNKQGHHKLGNHKGCPYEFQYDIKCVIKIPFVAISQQFSKK